MDAEKPEVEVIIKYPPPELKDMQKNELEQKVESAVVLFVPQLFNMGNITVRSEPKA